MFGANLLVAAEGVRVHVCVPKDVDVRLNALDLEVEFFASDCLRHLGDAPGVRQLGAGQKVRKGEHVRHTRTRTRTRTRIAATSGAATAAAVCDASSFVIVGHSRGVEREEVSAFPTFSETHDTQTEREREREVKGPVVSFL